MWLVRILKHPLKHFVSLLSSLEIAMPQPLSSVLPRTEKTAINLHHNAPIAFSELTSKAMLVVNLQSHVDWNMGVIFGALMGTTTELGIAIWKEVRGSRAKVNTIKSVAKIRLSASDFDLFNSLQKLATVSQKARDKLAHFVWATSFHIKEPHFLLIDPKYLWDWELDFQKFTDALPDPGPWKMENLPSEPPEIDPETIMVYRERDLERMIRDSHRCLTLVGWFKLYLIGIETQKKFVREWLEAELLAK